MAVEYHYVQSWEETKRKRDKKLFTGCVSFLIIIIILFFFQESWLFDDVRLSSWVVRGNHLTDTGHNFGKLLKH